MAKYPTYVNAYGKIPDVFEGIVKAAVPPRFTLDFLSTVLGLKSSSYRAMIPLLKKLNFLDQSSIPTDVYKKYRDDTISKEILAEQVKEAYSDIFMTHEYAYKLDKVELTKKLTTLIGVEEGDKTIQSVVGTFLELVKLSDFNKTDFSAGKPVKTESVTLPKTREDTPSVNHIPDESRENSKKIGISYTINLNLPATTEIEVYNVIFKALKDNLLYE